MISRRDGMEVGVGLGLELNDLHACFVVSQTFGCKLLFYVLSYITSRLRSVQTFSFSRMDWLCLYYYPPSHVSK